MEMGLGLTIDVAQSGLASWGPNLIDPAGWTSEPGWTVSNGVLTHDGSVQGAGVITRATQTITLEIGATYEFGLTVDSVTNVQASEIFAFIGADNIFGSITTTGQLTHTHVADAESEIITIRNSAAGEGDEAATISGVYFRKTKSA